MSHQEIERLQEDILGLLEREAYALRGPMEGNRRFVRAVERGPEGIDDAVSEIKKTRSLLEHVSPLGKDAGITQAWNAKIVLDLIGEPYRALVALQAAR
jgi:hypothetical protein